VGEGQGLFNLVPKLQLGNEWLSGSILFNFANPCFCRILASNNCHGRSGNPKDAGCATPAPDPGGPGAGRSRGRGLPFLPAPGRKKRLFLSFPSSSLGTQLSGEALLRPLYASLSHENPLYHQRTRGGTHFITCTVVKWLPIFTRKPYLDILLDSLKFCRQHKGLKLYAYGILDNHLHLVAAGEQLTDIIRDFKSYTAKRLITQLEEDQKTWGLNQLQYYKQPTKTRSDYQVWQEGFHPQQIVSQEMLHQKIDYLHHNPVCIGVVQRPEDWVYSSVRDYAGGRA